MNPAADGRISLPRHYIQRPGLPDRAPQCVLEVDSSIPVAGLIIWFSLLWAEDLAEPSLESGFGILPWS